MQSRAAGYRQVDMMSAWTVKYTLRVSLKISCPQSIYGSNQRQVQFYKLFSSLQLNWDMKCILIGQEASLPSDNNEMFWQYSLFCIFILGEISEVSSALK